MSAPVTPDELKALIPATTADKCTAFVKALIQIPLWLYEFFSWLITSEGLITEAAQRWLGVAVAGDIKPTFDPTDQRGWLDCNGAVVSRSTYSTLFAKIGTSYGAGDGSTTFQLPDLRGRVMGCYGAGAGLTARSIGETAGAERVTLTVANLPTGLTIPVQTPPDVGDQYMEHDGNSQGDIGVNIDPGDNDVPGSDTPVEVMQPTIFVRWLIKY